MKKSHLFTNVIILFVGSLLYTLSIYIFTIPAKFIPGGVSGIGSILQILVDFPIEYSLFLINFPLIIYAYKKLSKHFILNTFFCIILCTLLLKLYRVLNLYTFISDEPFVSAIAAGLLSGIGVGLLIQSGISTGGIEVVSMLIHKKITSLSISWIMFSVNILIIFIGGILYSLFLDFTTTEVIRIIIYSFFQVFMSSKSMELILNGMSTAVKFEIITKNATQLSAEIIKQMNRGVTIVDSKGGYSHEASNLLICVVARMQIGQLRRIIREIDPNAFVCAIDAREVLGSGFQKEKPYS